MLTRSLELARDHSAASTARAWLIEALSTTGALDTAGALAESTQSDLLVMSSELVANVMAHTRSNPRLSISMDGVEVRIEVSDDDTGEPTMQQIGPDRIGGNGLRIVDAWSRRWGVDHHPDGGKTVWFTVLHGPL